MAKSFGSFVRFAGGGLRPLTSPWGFSRLALRGAGQGATRPCTPCLLFLERVGRKLRHATSGQNPRMAPLCAGAADCPRCAGGRYTEVPWLARRAGRLRPFPRLATPGFCPPFANAATGCRVVAAVWGRGAAEIGCGCGLSMFRRQQTPLSLRSPGCRGSPPACPALYRRGKNGYTMNGIFGPFQEGC